MKKEERIKKVKDLLNEVVILCGENKDEFLQDAAASAKALVAPPPEEDEDYYDSDDVYDSNCF